MNRSSERVLQRAYTTEDLRLIAKRRLPRGLFEFIDRGSEDDLAVARNRRALEEMTLVPRIMKDVSTRSSAIELFGRRSSFPLCIGPTGAAGLVAFDGDLSLARAANEVGIPFVAATGSCTSLEAIADSAGQERWFQLYVGPELAPSLTLVERARRAGYHALVVTADAPVTPNRAHNARNGFSFPLSFNARSAADLVLHPRWLAGVIGRHLLKGGLPRHENLAGQGRPKITAGAVFNPKSDAVDWSVFAKLRRCWDGPLLVKGIMDGRDALAALAAGADGVIVSSHGGRLFDSAPASLAALPHVADRIEGRIAVLYDGGVSRGSDIAKAIALGADAALVGRAALWGLAAGGSAGVRHLLGILAADFDRTLAFTGSIKPGDLRNAISKPRAEGSTARCD